MAFDPFQYDVVLLIELVELLDEFEILDGAGFLLPAVTLPGGSPFGEDIDPKFGVGVDLDLLACSELDGLSDGGAFHADVGGVFATTGFYGGLGLGVDDCPATGAGIRLGAAVGIKNLHSIIVTYFGEK